MKQNYYTDGYLIPLKSDRLDDYRAAAEACSAIFKEYGAIEFVETVLDEDASAEMRPFAKAADAAEDEVVIFSYVVYPSKEVRDAATASVMADPRMEQICGEASSVFDFRRMSNGGFRTLVRA